MAITCETRVPKGTTKEIISNALLAHEKYSSYTLTKLMRNTKDTLLKMFEEIGGDLGSLEPKKEKRLKMAKVDLAMTSDIPNIGLTYSMTHYETFKLHNDKNIFEDVIDNLMIDEILSKDIKYRDDKDVLHTLKFGSEEHKKAADEFKTDVLNPLNRAKKRLKILKFLSDQNSVYVNIINIIKKKESKFSYIKDVVRELREYVVVADTATKEFGEVMTPLTTVKDMMTNLPDEVWSNPDLKWLDNSNGCGPFPAFIIYKLMVGLAEWEPDEELRYKHIIENMIYVAELQPKNMFLWLFTIDPKDEYKPNIYCGSFLESGFDYHSKNVWGVEKFDIVVGNPPYQAPINSNNRMKTLYNVFIEKSLLITDKILYIVPSRWMAGGFDLDNFRKMMFNRTDIKLINHFDNAQEIFGKDIDIKGGVQYIYIDKNHNGLVNYCGIQCKLGVYDIFVESKYYSILNKTISNNNLSNICKSKSYWMNFNDNTLDLEKNDSNTICYIAKNKGLIKYIKLKDISKSGLLTLDNYKVFTPAASGSSLNLGYFGNKIIGKPNEVCSNTYMTLFVNSELEANSLLSYMNTEFCNFFLSLRKNTQNIKPDTLKWIPLVPFDREWTDEKLFDYFELIEEEKELILN